MIDQCINCFDDTADSCTSARKYPNCCNRVDASACYVPGGNCYCDPLCTLYHDCCDDAETHLSQCELCRFKLVI